ncbi:MAG: hypothetical protein GOP50_09850 [Candidatus Heimdallarchaeota archaeon]|nr:hypothetical protein [Candidatus Heimdallarchaeota archaeon]
MTYNRIDKFSSLFFIILCLNSILYYDIQNPDTIDNESILPGLDPVNDIIVGDIPLPDDYSFLIKKETIPGNYVTKGFFSYSDAITSPSTGEGIVYQWSDYDEINHDSSGLIRARYGIGDIGVHRYPSADDTYLQGYNMWNEVPYIGESVMYSPQFTENTTLADKVHYIANIHRDTNEPGPTYTYKTMDITYKITLYHYFSSNDSIKEITKTEFLLPKIGETQTEYFRNFETNSTFGTYTIPAGDRIKVTYELKYEYSSVTQGHITTNIMSDGGGGVNPPGTNVFWDIDDGVHTPPNPYEFTNTDGILGVQLYMSEEIYPDINFYGPTNNSVYTTAETVNIAVSENSVSCYRWDGGSWNSFDSTALTSLPTTHEYHYLEVSASDQTYNNTRIEVLRLGYDATYDNLVLNNAVSGDRYAGGYILDFSTLNVLSANYSWDGDPTPVVLNSPYDITTPQFNGLHSLVVNTTDLFKTRTYSFEFYFDSNIPEIYLDNVVNNSFLLANKEIKLELLDYSDFTWLNYSWDLGSVQSWSSDISNIYSTYMPSGLGGHSLDIYVEDIYGHSNTTSLWFTTDPTVFSVDLRYMDDGGYYQGNNDVELIIQQSNGDVYYSWNGGSATYTILVTESLILSGGDSLPNTEGTHTLNITTFDTFSTRFVYIYTFYVDKTPPQFIGSYVADYNNTRLLDTQVLTFELWDNNISVSSLIVLYSVDEKIFKSFDTRFEFSLIGLSNGDHSFDIKSQDAAGNVNITRIYFTIDTTPPNIILVNMPDVIDDSAHGAYYVTTNALFQVFSSDADPDYYTCYSWDGQPYENFTDDFNLVSASDTVANLTIKAIDSLGLETVYIITLVYDTSAPEVFLLDPSPLDSINTRIPLEFNVTDYSPYTVASVEYEWNILALPAPSSWDLLSGEFSLLMTEVFAGLYADEEFANLTIIVEDLLGNSDSYTFDFRFDATAPNISFYFFNLVNTTMVPFVEYFVVGGTEIHYNISDEVDINTIEVYWDDEPEPDTILFSPNWTFTVPQDDGTHTLRVILYDHTGTSVIQHNSATTNFTFTVDDISVDFINPDDLDTNNQFTILYNDTFTYSVNVTDSFDGEIIGGLEVYISYNTYYNFSVSVSNVSTIYTVTIHALDVTNSLEMPINVQFYQGSLARGQTVTVLLTVALREGILTILDDTVTSVEFYEEFEIVVNFQNDLGSNLTIENLFANGTEVLEINATESECRFNYSSIDVGHKGNFSLVISVESLYYFSTSSINTTITLEIRPIRVFLQVWVSNTTILEGQTLTISANLTYIDGSPIPFETIAFIIYIYYKNDTTITPELVMLAFSDYNDTEEKSDTTNFAGTATITFVLDETIDHIGIGASFAGTPILDVVDSDFNEFVITFPPPAEFPKWLLYTIIGGSIALAAIISFIIYKFTRPKSFEELLSKVTPEEMALNYSIMSPGIILTIFDQRKGPIPLVGDHSLEIGRYIGRMRIGIENFLLKIADQAYSSLGFEEHDAGRRVGSIILPTEKMTGFIHGIQIPNKMARGGFENLSLIVLADAEYGTLLLNYQEHIYSDIDALGKALKEKKPLKEIEEIVKAIRIKSVQVMIAAQGMEEQQASSD